MTGLELTSIHLSRTRFGSRPWRPYEGFPVLGPPGLRNGEQVYRYRQSGCPFGRLAQLIAEREPAVSPEILRHVLE